MPLFQYRAQDSQGRTVEGAVSANDASSAQSSLTSRGLRIFEIVEKGGSPAAPKHRPPTQSPPSAIASRPAGQQIVQPRIAPPDAQVYPDLPPASRASFQPSVAPGRPSGPQRVNLPAAAPVHIHRTQPGSDKANTFLFAQLASFFKAGVNPAEAFTMLSQRHPKPHYRESLALAAKETAEGVRFSQVLKRYPDLYPPHIPGMIQAGEEGGFLVEATEAVAEQTEQSRKFKVAPTVLFWFTFANVIFLPPAWIMVRATLDSWDAQEKSGGSANGWAVLGHSMVQSLKWPVGPLTLVTMVALWLGAKWWLSMPRREARHRAVLWVPTIGKRAKAESVATFAWVLSMVSRAGVAPRTAWDLAVGAMPNLALQAEMRAVGEKMQDGSKLSEALYGTKLIPEEYGAIVQTGEMTGTVSGALMNASNASRDDFKREGSFAVIRIGIWGFLVAALMMLVAFYLVYGVFYPQIMNKVTAE